MNKKINQFIGRIETKNASEVFDIFYKHYVMYNLEMTTMDCSNGYVVVNFIGDKLAIAFEFHDKVKHLLID